MRNIFKILWFTLNGWLGGVFIALAVVLPADTPIRWAWLLAAVVPASLILYGLHREAFTDVAPAIT